MARKWLVLIAVYIGGVASSVNQFKVPPVMELIVQDLNLSVGTAGWLMSCFALAGFLLALPAGLIIKTHYLKLVSIIGLIVLTIGSVLGALSTGPYILLLGRVFEGIGLLAIGMTGPSLISLWFPSNERGLPLGIWTSWMPTGSIVMFNLAQPLTIFGGGWRTIWWFASLLSFVALILVIIFVSIPNEAKHPNDASVPKDWRDISRKVFFNRNLWLLSLMFISYNFVISCYYSWAPVYLRQALEFSPAKAAFTVSVIHMGIIPSTIIAGWVINRLKNHRYVYLTGFIAFTLFMFKAYSLNKDIIFFYMLTLGLLSGFIPTAIFAATPEVIEDKSYVTFAVGAILWGQNLGVMLGPSSVGKLLALGVTWNKMTYLLVLGAVVGLFAGIISRVKQEPMKKIDRFSSLN